MTDDAADRADPSPPPRRRALRQYALWAAQALVVLLLLDGFIDFAYTTTRAVVSSVTHAEHVAAVAAVRPNGGAQFKRRVVPGLGVLVEPVAAPGLNVDSFGRRSTGNAPREGPRGVLLGSSQAFGFSVADNATLAAAIERRFGDVTVENFAGPGRTAAESMANWQSVADDIHASDFGILLFSNIELYKACWLTKDQEDRQLAIVALAAGMLRRVRAAPETYPCATPEARAGVVERAVYEVRAALAVGRARTPHFTVVIAPLIFGNDADVPALRATVPAPFGKTLDLAIRAFRKRLAAENIPGVIDLSTAFDADGKRYFIDDGSHFDRAGADLLAAKMIERLPPGFFGPAER